MVTPGANSGTGVTELRAAPARPLTWRVATIAAIREETVATRSLVLEVSGWPGHVAGQHVDVRLTAEDGYSAQRSYSLASDPSTVEITVQRVSHGEVSPYLCDVAGVGDQFEVRGPVGGYFTWQPERTDPVLLVAGGSGVVPLMAMIRTRAWVGSRVPFRLVYSARDPDSLIYGEELAQRVRDDQGLDVTIVYTRQTPTGWDRPPGRVNAQILAEAGWPVSFEPACFVCGPTGFVEAAANLLVEAGHAATRIRTERFGPTG
jgi:ferredoxin-NADP reductase